MKEPSARMVVAKIALIHLICMWPRQTCYPETDIIVFVRRARET